MFFTHIHLNLTARARPKQFSNGINRTIEAIIYFNFHRASDRKLLVKDRKPHNSYDIRLLIQSYQVIVNYLTSSRELPLRAEFIVSQAINFRRDAFLQSFLSPLGLDFVYIIMA